MHRPGRHCWQQHDCQGDVHPRQRCMCQQPISATTAPRSTPAGLVTQCTTSNTDRGPPADHMRHTAQRAGRWGRLFHSKLPSLAAAAPLHKLPSAWRLGLLGRCQHSLKRQPFKHLLLHGTPLLRQRGCRHHWWWWWWRRLLFLLLRRLPAKCLLLPWLCHCHPISTACMRGLPVLQQALLLLFSQ